MNDLYFSYNEAVITPSREITPSGFPRRSTFGEGNSGVIDDLLAKVLLLRCGSEKLALITLDFVSTSLEVSDEIRQEVASALDIKTDNVMVSAVHNHSGISIRNTSMRFTSPMDIDRKVSKVEPNPHLAEYYKWLKATIVTMVKDCDSRQFPAKLYSSTFHGIFGYNRRYIDGNEADFLVNLWQEPDKVPTGVVDPEIPVLVLERQTADGEGVYTEMYEQKRIVLFSVPYHPVILGYMNRKLSTDYVGEARRTIEETLGDGTKAMFLLGACGNTKPMISRQASYEPVKVMGRAIGYSVVLSMAARKEVKVDKISSIQEDYKGKDEDLDTPRGSVIKEKGLKRGVDFNNRIITQVFQLGNSIIAGVSAECFTELGIEIRKGIPCQQALISTVTNGTAGYMPTKDEFKYGGYEVMNCVFEEDVLNQLVNMVVKNAKKALI